MVGDPIILLAFMALLIAMCMLLDNIIQGKHMRGIHTALVGWWDRLDEIPVIDFPRTAAERTLAWLRALVGKQWFSWRSVAVAVLLSHAITTLALLFGVWVSKQMNAPLTDVTNSFWALFGNHVAILYVSNFVFDVGTVAVTTAVLLRIVRTETSWSDAGWLLLDTILAFVLAVLCVVGVSVLSHAIGQVAPSVGFANDFIFPAYGEALVQKSASAVWRTTGAFLSFGGEGATFDIYGIYAVTTFLPTLLYVGLLLILIAGKLVLTIGRRGLLYTVEAVTEYHPEIDSQAPHFKPFTALGLVLTVLVAMIELVVVLARSVTAVT